MLNRLFIIRTIIVTMCFSVTSILAAPVLHSLGALPPKVIKPAATPKATAAALPASVDLRQWAVPVGNQGSVGSCVAWTIAYSMMGWYANRNGSSTTLFAPMYMYSQINHGSDNGSYPVDGFNLAIEQGNDTKINYWQGDFDWYNLPTSAERINAAKYKFFASFQTLFTGPAGTNGVYAIKASLAASNPVAISLPVRPGFDNLSTTNTLDNDTTGAIRGYHEVLAIGYDTYGLLVQNQWGTSWGSSGYGRLSWNVVQQDVIEANVVTAKTPTPPSPNNEAIFIIIQNLLLN